MTNERPLAATGGKYRDESALHGALTRDAIGAAMEVHSTLGPGLLESAYQACLCHELTLRGIPFEREVPFPVRYKAISLDAGLRMDLAVDQKLVAELKAVDRTLPIHGAQLMTYLKLTGLRVGLLINFNVQSLPQGITRRVL